MTTFNLSDRTHSRARRNTGSAGKDRTRNPHGAGYVRDTIMQCPKHHVDYVLRPSKRVAPTLLIYDCPEAGCLITLQVAAKR